MSLKDDYICAVEDEIVAIDAYNMAQANRQRIGRMYYEQKYGVGIGDVVYTDDSRQTEIKIVDFKLWSRDVDAKPDVIGHERLPFGWSKGIKTYRGDQWMLPEQEDADGNQ